MSNELVVSKKDEDLLKNTNKKIPLTYNENEYNEVFLGILDILGFSSFTKSEKEKAPKIIIKIFETLYIESKILFDDIEVKFLSDTIILFTKDKSILSLIKLCTSLYNFKIELLEKGFLSRGSIVLGENYIKKEILISEAFINAYKLEENDAIFPRVLIQDKVYDFFINETKENKYKTGDYFSKNILIRDFDDKYILNQFEFFSEITEYIYSDFYSVEKNKFNKSDKKNIDIMSIHINNIKKDIISYYNKNKSILKKDISIHLKYEYICSKYNELVNKLIFISDNQRKLFQIKIRSFFDED